MIKFRVWDKRYHTYLSPIKVGNMLWDALNSKDYIVEQFTGLQDNNGVDIYVGDIMAISKLKVLVYYEKNNASFRLKSTLDDYALTVDKVKRLEVIGNINENKELLNVGN